MEAEEQAKQLDSVTDRVQEQEVDADRAQQAMSALSEEHCSTAADPNKKTIEVSKVDVDLIVSELEVTEELAERTLRQVAAEGQDTADSLVVAALRKLVTS
jgi:transcriptional regulator of met regulon